MPKSTNSFFSLIVAFAALIASVSLATGVTRILTRASSEAPETITYAYTLSEGINFVSPVLLPSKQTSRTLCTKIPNLISVGYYNTSGNKVQYKCDGSVRNVFNIEPHKAYVLEAKEATTWILQGREIKPNYSLVLGWQGLGFPQADVEGTEALNLCDGYFDESKYSVSEVYQIIDGKWQGFNCILKPSTSNVNFKLHKGMGYLLKTIEPGKPNDDNPPSLD